MSRFFTYRMLLKVAIAMAASYFPWASPRTARRQAAKLIRAKLYVRQRGLTPYPFRGESA